MFKNLRNKLAVLALVAVGLAFGNAWSSQASKTKGELIYEAITNGQLPDEKTGAWIIAPEATHERKEQKEEKEQKQDSSSTSKWTISRDGTSATEELSAGIQSKIKNAVKRLLKNDDVVKYITIHNIASGHMDAKNADTIGTIKVENLPAMPQVSDASIKLIRELNRIYLKIRREYADFFCTLFRDFVKFACTLSQDKQKCQMQILYGILACKFDEFGIDCDFSKDFWCGNSYVDVTRIKDLVDIACCKDYSGVINVKFYDIKQFKAKEIPQSGANLKNIAYILKMYFAAKLYETHEEVLSLREKTKQKIQTFIDADDIQVTVQADDFCIKQNIKQTRNGAVSLILTLDKDMDNDKQVYIKHFGPQAGGK